MKYLNFIALIILFFSCKKDKLDIDVSNVNINLKITRIEKSIFVDDSIIFKRNLESIKNEHRSFFDIYSNYILKIGTFDTPGFEYYLESFVKDTVIKRVADSTLEVFIDFEFFEDDIKEGFKHYKYYYPDEIIPSIYTCISGFNQSIITSDNVIGISLDKYLGSDCVFYNYLGIPQYKSENMYPEKIVPDLFYSWYITKFHYRDSIDNLLSNMIYQGKALYFTKAMKPDIPDSVIIGYSAPQIKWCKQNEASMWTFLIENKLLYDVERLTLQKFTGDAPFTNTFSNDSPGRTGSWIGWRIIQSFMKKNPDISLQQLLEIRNAQEILSKSGYFPE